MVTPKIILGIILSPLVAAYLYLAGCALVFLWLASLHIARAALGI